MVLPTSCSFQSQKADRYCYAWGDGSGTVQPGHFLSTAKSSGLLTKSNPFFGYYKNFSVQAPVFLPHWNKSVSLVPFRESLTPALGINHYGETDSVGDRRRQLGTTEQVIKNYLRNVYDKTGVSDRLELALFTIHHRILAEAAAQAGGKMELRAIRA